MKYDIYLFDLDGTLTDPKIGITKSFQYALAEFGIHEELDNLTKFIGPPLRESFGGYGFSESDIEKAVSKFREYFVKTGMFENTVYHDIPDILQNLKDRGRTLAVATSKVTEYANRILEHFNLAQYFDFVSGDEMDGSLTKHGKRDIIQIALDNLDSERKMSTVMIGDRKHDVLGANDVGIDSIGVMWSCYGSRDELETSGATWIVDNANEICDI